MATFTFSGESKALLLTTQARIQPMMVVSFEDYKNALGKEAEKFSDDEIRKQMILQERLASVLFDMWLANSERTIVSSKGV